MSEPFADSVRAAAIRTLYIQIRNAFAAAMVVTVYMTVTAWLYNPPAVVLGWAAVQISTQLLRLVLVLAYRRANPPDEALARWAAYVTAYMALAGAVWGSTAFLFIHPEEPITLALTLCGLYGISSGSVPGNAYNPPGLYAFVGLIFASVFVRLVIEPTPGHFALGIASLGFAAIMLGFCRVQARTIAESLRARFENLELLEQLRVRTAEAEEARRRAEQASLAKSQFLAAASHDLRQPLYALSLFSSSLEGLKLSREGRSVVSRIQANIDALEDLFSGLLDISRLQAGVITPTLEPVSLGALFARLEAVFQPVAAEKGLGLAFSSEDLWVQSDPVLLEQILVNLIGNGLRYTTEGGVTVRAVASGEGRARLEVADTGVGVAEADLARIFDDFVQLANPERDRRKGMGLGLAICRRAAALLGSEIEVTSRPGAGSRFAFAQPIAQTRALPASASAAGDDPLAGLNLLFVDDEPEIREGLTRLVGQWGVAVEAVADAPAALALVETGRRYDAILCDYRLAGEMDGLVLLEQLLRRHGGAAPRAWLVTGDLDPDLMARAQASGAPLLHKPLKAAQLRALLSHAASGAELAARTAS